MLIDFTDHGQRTTDNARLTPYAVELRYDDAFAPSLEVAEQARDSALAARDFVLDRLPEEIAQEPH